MATFTENYNLIKPSEEDYYDVQDFNENMDAIDGQMAEQERQTAAIDEKIGTPTTEGNTLFSLLEASNQGNGIIKSIQHVIFQTHGYTEEGSVSIATVNPEKCFVIFERLKDFTSSGCTGVNYTLSANAIDFTIDDITNQALRLGFWVLEFY